MSHIWYAVIDKTKQKLDIGQGYRKVGLWYGVEDTMDAFAELLDIAYNENTTIRIVGEDESYEPPCDDYTTVQAPPKLKAKETQL